MVVRNPPSQIDCYINKNNNTHSIYRYKLSGYRIYIYKYILHYRLLLRYIAIIKYWHVSMRSIQRIKKYWNAAKLWFVDYDISIILWLLLLLTIEQTDISIYTKFIKESLHQCCVLCMLTLTCNNQIMYQIYYTAAMKIITTTTYILSCVLFFFRVLLRHELWSFLFHFSRDTTKTYPTSAAKIISK